VLADTPIGRQSQDHSSRSDADCFLDSGFIYLSDHPFLLVGIGLQI
jgi:hypothetical protein